MVTHREPAWRDRSDHVISVAIDPTGSEYTAEQLWARRVDERHLDHFFAYGIALGDVVRLTPTSQSSR